MEYPVEISELPIVNHLDSICENLKNSKSRFLVLSANTGAGKSTSIPLALLKHFTGDILMLEPRRIAVLNIAHRVSALLKENVGETCGYSIHLDNKTSSKTRFTVLTEAILTRKMQSDPSLDGVSVVVLDEFHERSIHADLALAFLKEVMSIRDDLYVLIMSATINTRKLQGYLGGTDLCPFYSVPGKLYPVEVLYENNLSMEKCIQDCLKSQTTGTILAFLPGIGEIRRVQNQLEDYRDVDIEILHSSVPIEKQKKVLEKVTDGRRRVVLSSAIAETSLTIPDVTVVIDSGLSRVNEYDKKLGMERLVTRQVSVFNANQRAGRAGRTCNGKCIRLWSENETLLLEQTPEILRTDLTSLVLECAEWGATDFSKLSWLDSPTKGSWESAVETLTMLGCLKDRKITDIGRAALMLGVHPRIALVIFSGIPVKKIELSTEIAVDKLLTDQINQRTRDFYVENLKNRVQICIKNLGLSTSFPQQSTKFSTGYALLCGYPDRLAVQDSINSSKYKFPSGRYASIFDTKNSLAKYIVAPEVDAGITEGKIYSFENLDCDFAEQFMRDRLKTEVQIVFDSGNNIRKTEVKSYGKIVLKETKLSVLEEDYVKALCSKVKKDGLSCLPQSVTVEDFLRRVQFYISNCSLDSDETREIYERYQNIQESVEEWLPPFLPAKQKISGEIVYNAIFYYLSGETINKKVPKELMLANGRKRKIVYEKQSDEIVPVIEIIIQQLFGCFETPKIMGVPVLFKMLSPARRPLQITKDLENFWINTWPEICAEMKGRYPKHNWDYRKIVEDN